MDEYESLGHTKWECKYHVVFIPKSRRKVLYSELRRHLTEIFHELARRGESRIEEGHLMPDHVHTLLSVPPKYSVSQVVGYLKDKSARFIWRGRTEKGKGISPASTSGQGATLSRRLGGRSGDSGVHPESGKRGSPLGSDESVALRAP